MIKILELIDGGFIGGGQIHILSVCRNVNKDKIETIVAASPEGEFKKLALNEKLKFKDILLPKFYRTKHLNKLMDIITDEKIDMIHSHGGVAGVYARMARKKKPSLKVLHTIHGIHYTSKDLVTKVISMMFEQYLVKFTDKTICVSETDLKKAASLKIIDINRTVIIKNGINLKRFSGKTADEAQKNKLQIKEGDLIIGNISRFDFQKNQRILIAAFAELVKKHPHIKLLLVGAGKHYSECRKTVKELGLESKVIFTGEVIDTAPFYPLIDIFVFPSLWEGLSITLIEAMASSRCILTSAIPENLELIQDNVNGTAFDVNSSKDLVDKLEVLINNKDLREKLSAGAGNDRSRYDEAAMAQKIEAEYLALAGGTL